jgi:hypothetical protein
MQAAAVIGYTATVCGGGTGERRSRAAAVTPPTVAVFPPRSTASRHRGDPRCNGRARRRDFVGL